MSLVGFMVNRFGHASHRRGFLLSTGLLSALSIGLITWNVVTAATGTVLPDTDVTAGWAVLGGTSDGSCAGGTHCDYIDEGTTPNTSDYIGTGTNGSGGEVEEFGLTTLNSVASVSQVQICIHAQSATNANGGNLDTVDINLRVGGTLQTAVTVTPAYITWADHCGTFTGTWTQDQLNGMQAYLIRNRVGGGSPSGQDDDVRVASVYATVTYTLGALYEQSGYRWFDNKDYEGDATFVKAVGGANEELAQFSGAVAQTSDGGYGLAGHSTTYTAGSGDMFLNKYDGKGALLWSRNWGQAGYDYRGAMAPTSDGGFMMTGYTSLGAGSIDTLLLKYDSSGAVEWSRTWGGTGDTSPRAVIQTSDGGYAVTGHTTGYGAGLNDMYLLKYSSTGTMEWVRTWGGTGEDYGYGLIQLSDGSYAISGSTASYGSGGNDAFLAKYDSSGTLSWSRTWGGAGADMGQSLKQAADGGLILVGDTASYGAGSNDAFLAKYDSSGTLSWSRTWGGASADYGYSVAVANDDGYVVSGRTDSFGAGAGDAFLAKYDSSGTLSWSRTWGGTGLDLGLTVLATGGGGYAIGGNTASYGGGGTDMFFAKYDSTGTITGCGAGMCMSPTATVGVGGIDYTPGTTSPSAGTSSPTASTVSQTATAASPSPVDTTVVALSLQGIDVDAPRATLNTVMTAPADGVPFRLRMNLHVDTGNAAADSANFKLQVAVRGSDNVCDTSFTNETYADVSTSSGAIRYYNNPSGIDSQPLIANANDPTHSGHTLVRQSYEESNNFTVSNLISVGEDGMWDFALVVDSSAPSSTNYCFRTVHSDGSVINAYSVVPEIATPAPAITQSSSRWYDDVATGDQTFVKAYGGMGNDIILDHLRTSDGGYITTGQTESYGAGLYDMVLSKYDSSGTLSWSKTWGGTGTDLGRTVRQTSDGGYIVAGDTDSFGQGNYDVFLAKYDSSGTLSWNKTWGGTALESAYGVVQTSDGGYAVVGQTASYGSGGNDGLLIKYDSTGAVTWNTVWGGSTSDRYHDIVQTSDGGYAVAGQSNSFTSTFAAIMVKYSSTGTVEWNKAWDGSAFDATYGLAQTSDNGYVVAGETSSFGAGGIDTVLMKYDSTGGLLWNKTIGGATTDVADSVIVTTDGGVVVAGRTNSYGNGDLDGLLARYSGSGTLEWARTLGGSASDFYYSVQQTPDGGYGIGGRSNSYGAGLADLLLVKTDDKGIIAGCTPPVCGPFSPTESTPSVTIDTPTATTSAPSAGVTTPTASEASPTPTTTDVAVAAKVPDLGAPRAAMNAAATAPAVGTSVRLRVLVGLTAGELAIAAQSFKLQVASTASTCSNSLSYSDVSSSNGGIRYYDNTAFTDSFNIGVTADDPTNGSDVVLPQVYRESNNFSNAQSALAINQYGLFDFALVNNSAADGTYCFRVVKSDGSLFDTYSNFPQLTVSGGGAAEPTLSQQMRGGQSVIDGIKRVFSW